MVPDILLMVVLASTCGAAIGTFTGLIPGIHVNTAATILLGLYPAMENAVEDIVPAAYVPILVSCCIMSASATHSFVDFVPSVFIGAPNEDTVLSMLPGHRLLRQGLGMVAVRSAAIGSAVGSMCAIVLSLPLQWIMLAGAERYIDYFTEGILIVTIAVIVLSSNRKFCSLTMLVVSGLLGYGIAYAEPFVCGIADNGTLLFPLLTGLFGMAPLLEKTARSRSVKQHDRIHDPVGAVPALKGVVTGLVAGWFPGITATAGAVLTSSFSHEKDPARFISMTASIGTVTSVFSIVTLSVSGSGRSGTCLVIKEIIGDSLNGFCSEAFMLILLSIALASALGYCLTVSCGRFMSKIYAVVPENLLNNLILVLVTALVFVFTGPVGLALLAISAAIGMVPPALGFSRVCLTGCLMIPVLFG